jgi:uncharacterized membrane protein YwzB
MLNIYTTLSVAVSSFFVDYIQIPVVLEYWDGQDM